MKIKSVAAAVVALAAAASAFAISPQFKAITTSFSTETGALTVNFSETGLGNTVMVSYSLTGAMTYNLACYNRGTNKVNGKPFQISTGTETVTASFQSGKNGRVNGQLVLAPTDPDYATIISKAQADHCGEQFAVCVKDVTVSGELKDTTNYPYPTADISGTYAGNCPSKR